MKTKIRKRWPSRERVRYAGIPTEYWNVLVEYGRPDGFSVSALVRRAVREHLARLGLVDKQGRVK